MKAFYLLAIYLVLLSVSEFCGPSSPRSGELASNNERSPAIDAGLANRNADRFSNQGQSPKCRDDILPCEVYWAASDVFIGEVIEIIPLDRPAIQAAQNRVPPVQVGQIRFQVEKPYRGTKQTQVLIENVPDHEGRSYPFVLGEKYLISAHGSYGTAPESRLVIDVCSHIKPVSQAEEEIRYAEEQSRKYPNGRLSDALISGGFIQGRAISLPKPALPKAAREAKVSGRVYVLLEVNEKGKAIKAEAVCGHHLLKEAAQKAAMQARFSPMLLSGKPVKVSGVIIYDFSTP